MQCPYCIDFSVEPLCACANHINARADPEANYFTRVRGRLRFDISFKKDKTFRLNLAHQVDKYNNIDVYSDCEVESWARACFNQNCKPTPLSRPTPPPSPLLDASSVVAVACRVALPVKSCVSSIFTKKDYIWGEIGLRLRQKRWDVL